MKLLLKRIARRPTYTIGRLYIDGVFECDTLEDCDRGLTQKMSAAEISASKIYGETSIPTGTYDIAMNTVSPKYSAVTWYKKLNGGKMPRLLNVPGFEGVLIHPGNTALDSFGCVLVGKNNVVGKVTQSREAFAKLYQKMKEAADDDQTITLTIE